MIKPFLLSVILLAAGNAISQAPAGPMLESEASFEQMAAEKGSKAAYLTFFSDDAIIFRPNAVNCKEFWKSQTDSDNMTLTRKTVDHDISSNGLMGYTTGNWKLAESGKTDESSKFGQFVTIWEKRANGKFLATVDIATTHDKLSDDREKVADSKSKDANARGWSVADASMNFLKMSMTSDGLAGAYKQFGSDEVRLLIEREPPIVGKKKVVGELKRYTSISFPKRVAMLQAADLAYTWNPCQFANSVEGTESGNCLQIWKLREKKWFIVVSVFARTVSENKPELKVRSKSKRSADRDRQKNP